MTHSIQTAFEGMGGQQPPIARPTTYRIPVYQIQLVRDGHADADRRQTTAPADAAKILRDWLGDPDREMFVCMLLDHRNRPVGLHTVHVGTLSASLVRVADVFKAGILANASAMIVAHNHPSGDPSPSRDDISVTQKLVDAGKLLEIKILDHVILGEGERFYSMREHGMGGLE